MIFLGQNLKALRDAKSLTQQGLADDLKLKKSAISNYENNFSKPGYDVLKLFSDYFGVSVDNLLYNQYPNFGNDKNKELVQLNVNPTVQLITEKQPDYGKTDRIKTARAALVEAESHFREPGAPNVYDLDGAAAAGNAIALLEEDKLKPAPTLYLPEIGSGLNIRISAAGDSMYPTIKPEDKVVASWVSDGWQSIREGHVHVIIDMDDEVAVKRLYLAPKNRLQLVSDNDVYRPYFRDLSDIRAVFEVRQVHTTDLRHELLDMRLEFRKIRNEWASFQPIMEKVQGLFGS